MVDDRSHTIPPNLGGVAPARLVWPALINSICWAAFFAVSADNC